MLPTPAVAFLTGMLDADLGVMLSASHNPMPDNGIKFFAKGGQKLDDAIEDAIEARLREPWNRPTGAEVGRVHEHPEGLETYISHVVGTAPGRLEGLRVVVDCAHGAAYRAAPEALRRLGADVVAVCAEPDGLNINHNCGSTHLDVVAAEVVAAGADVGIAHDGDADRCLAVDATGEVVDGDQILAVLALAMRSQGALRRDSVVATVMSNEGFRLAMRQAGVNVIDTAVGDRYVLEAMKSGGYNLGGEQSGHVVMLDHGTTGDGVLTAVHLLRPGRVDRHAAGRAGRGRAAAPAGPGQRQGRRQEPGHASTKASRPPSPRPRPSSAPPAESCSARPAPSRSCGSWSRPPPPSRPRPSPAGWPRPSRPNWPSDEAGVRRPPAAPFSCRDRASSGLLGASRRR